MIIIAIYTKNAQKNIGTMLIKIIPIFFNHNNQKSLWSLYLVVSKIKHAQKTPKNRATNPQPLDLHMLNGGFLLVVANPFNHLFSSTCFPIDSFLHVFIHWALLLISICLIGDFLISCTPSVTDFRLQVFAYWSPCAGWGFLIGCCHSLSITGFRLQVFAYWSPCAGWGFP
jgi:hypothetical protein